MVQRLHSLQHQNRLSKLKIQRLKDKIASIIDSQSVPTDDETASDLEVIMKEEESVALQGCAEGSFKQIFWQQQKQAASRRVFNGTFS
jgi:hypothetical protein